MRPDGTFNTAWAVVPTATITPSTPISGSKLKESDRAATSASAVIHSPDTTSSGCHRIGPSHAAVKQNPW